MAQPRDCLLIAIDFGTTYSGAAWAWSARPDDLHVVQQWSGNLGMKNSVKVPSQILYKDGTIRWGFDIPLGEKPLQWFKVFLLQEEDMRQPFMDEKFRDWLSFREARDQLKGLKKTAADVVADYLKLLWQWVIVDMGKTLGEAPVAALPFRVVITCPAIWPLYAQSRIRQAAAAAGILDHRVGGETFLDLLPEPEAAVLSIMEDFDAEPVEDGDIFTVCDVGGGTVDLITYQVKDATGWQLSECVPGAGKLCGGAFVDGAFEQKMSQWVTPRRWKKFADEDKQKWKDTYWEHSLKRNFTGSESEVGLALPVELTASNNIGVKSLFQRTGERKAKNSQLLLRGSDIANIFDVSVDQIVVLVQQQIQRTQQSLHKTPKAVLLVGGFGQSPYLYSRLQAEIRDHGVEIRRPAHDNAWTAVCRGALLRARISHAQESGGIMRGAMILSRITRLSYGIETMERFDPTIHNAVDKYYSPSVGDFCAIHQMHWYIKANEVINDHTTIKLDWSKKIKAPLPNNRFTVVLFHCARDNPPRRREEDVIQAGVIECVVNNPFDQLPAYTSADGEVWRVVEFQLEVKIQGTLIEFAAYYNGRKQQVLQIIPPYAALGLKSRHASRNPRKSPVLSPIPDSPKRWPIQNETEDSITSPIESISLRGRDVAYSITSTISSAPSLFSELPSRPISPATTLDLNLDSVDGLSLHWRNFDSLGVAESPLPAGSSREIKSSVLTTEKTLFTNSDVSPETLRSVLASGNLDNVQRLLDEHFDSVADEDFVWLLELRQHEYTTEEIAQLLINEQNESPWIYFEPHIIPPGPAIRDHHQPLCVHTGGRDVKLDTSLTSRLANIDLDHQSWNSDDETMMYLEELCGFAGVVPSSPDLSNWVGTVKFEENDDELLAASVSFRPLPESSGNLEQVFAPTSLGDMPDLGLLAEISKKAIKALENLCNGIGLAQRSGICCDSFTFLYLLSGPVLISDLVYNDLIELRQVQVTTVLNLHSKLAQLHAELRGRNRNFDALLGEIDDCIKAVFQGHKQMDNLFLFFPGIAVIEHAALIAQFLCLAFASYLRAHVGPFQPFFLDAPLQTIHLLAGQDLEVGRPYITASLYRFTCLDNMIQNPVLVFKDCLYSGKEKQTSYDLLTSLEDLVDTWGPGQFVTSGADEHMPNLSAVLIGGGVVKPAAEHSKILHWSNDVDPRHSFSVRFLANEKTIISGVVKVNTKCQAKQSERWALFMSSLENLGTSPDYWQFTEFQAGVAVMGQQFAGGQLQFNKTWTWHPGNSCKSRVLSSISEALPFSELDRPWGLQVSTCTGVARRVPLRVLLADVMPSFVQNLALPPGWTTLQEREIITALQKGDLKKWYNELCDLPNFQELQTLVWRLIKYILLVLRDTGVDREHKTFRIACAQDYTSGEPITMCLPIRCENSSLWAKILTDSEHCATFAYMMPICLESEKHKCQKTNPWHCPSLDTAVYQLRASNEAIIVPSQAWNLQANTLYWIGKPESGLQARAVRSADSPVLRLYISKSGIPQKTRARLGTMSKFFGPRVDRLRERQTESWPAEDVLILS